MRILFVDDEARVLDGLRRLLFRQRAEWSMHFATTGAEALEIMAKDSFDLIVTDMRMPLMDGAELLGRVREVHPRAVRIVLSGHADVNQAVRAMDIAHQYLSKPCDGPTLIATIEQAGLLRRMLDQDELRELVLRIGHLPSAPATYARMMKLMSDPNSCIEDFAELLEKDPALTAKLLQVANSAFFANDSRVTRAAAAASRIGLQALRALTLFLEAPDQFGDKSPGVEAISREVADRGQRAAALARRLCATPSGRETATTAALMHELGRLAIASRLENEYARVVAHANASGQPLVEVEREVFGADHAAVGAYLLTLWQLPGEMVEAIARHHDPGPLPDPLDALGAVRLATAWVSDAIPDAWREDPRWDEWRTEAVADAEAA